MGKPGENKDLNAISESFLNGELNKDEFFKAVMESLDTEEIKDSANDDDDTIDKVTNDDLVDDFSLTDKELDDIEKSIDDESIAAAAGDDEEVELTPDEEMDAVEDLTLAATSALINDELNADEKKDFISTEAEIAIEEGVMQESDLYQVAYDVGLITEASYNKKMLIRLDAESKKRQLYKLAVNCVANRKNDPDYIKYKKCLKLKKIYAKKLETKYKNSALKLMRAWWARLKKSKSKTLNSLADRLKK